LLWQAICEENLVAKALNGNCWPCIFIYRSKIDDKFFKTPRRIPTMFNWINFRNSTFGTELWALFPGRNLPCFGVQKRPVRSSEKVFRVGASEPEFPRKRSHPKGGAPYSRPGRFCSPAEYPFTNALNESASESFSFLFFLHHAAQPRLALH